MSDRWNFLDPKDKSSGRLQFEGSEFDFVRVNLVKNKQIIVCFSVKDEIYDEIKMSGFYDKYMIITLVKFAQAVSKRRKNFTFFDVGANVGWFSIVFASLFENVRVEAFEPNANTMLALSANREVNGLSDQISLNEVVLLGERKAVEEQTNGFGSQSEFRAVADGAVPIATTVLSRTLDDYIDQESPVDFLKIDVNGDDFNILVGGQDFIRRHQPVIFIEFTPSRISPDDFMTMLSLFQELNYSAHFWRAHKTSGSEAISFRTLKSIYYDWRAAESWMNIHFRPMGFDFSSR